MEEILGRYVLYEEIAAGGMAAVHIGRMRGARGFARTVAIKRLHPHVAKDPDFVAMFLDEAHLAARVRHPNVVSVLDVAAQGPNEDLILVMDYVNGESLSHLVRLGGIPLPVVSRILHDALEGLHAAHEATSERGEPLQLVHRDVSPQNILVGFDGITRVVDFGIAKAISRIQTTRDGAIKGKLSYMAPEQLLQEKVDRRADVYAASVVGWEACAGQRLFVADNVGALVTAVLAGPTVPLPAIRADVPEELAALLHRGMAPAAADRFATAHEMAQELERISPPAPRHRVAEWMAQVDGERMRARRARLTEIESEELPSEGDLGRDPRKMRARAISAVTLADAPTPTPARTGPSAWRSRSGLLILALLVVGAGLGGWALAAGRVAPAAASTSAPQGASATDNGATVSEPSAPTAPAAATAATASVASATAAPAALVASAPPVAAAPPPPPGAMGPAGPASRARPVAGRPPAKGGRAAATSCNPPYFVDADGIKRAKAGCY